MKPTQSSTNSQRDLARTAAIQCSTPQTTAILLTASSNTRKNQQAKSRSSLKRQKRDECSATPSAKSPQYYDTAQTRFGACYRVPLAITTNPTDSISPTVTIHSYQPALPPGRYQKQFNSLDYRAPR